MPGISSVHVDQPLKDLALAQVPVGEYATRRVLKPMMVGKQSDKIWELGAETFVTAAPATGKELFLVAPGTPYPRVEYSVTTSDAYFCQKRGLEIAVPDELDANYDSPQMHRAIRTAIVMMSLESAAEQRRVALLTSTSTLPNAAPAAKWDADAANPWADRDTAIEYFRSKGLWHPSTTDLVCVVGLKAWHRFRHNPGLTDKIKGVRDASMPTAEDWRRYLDVDEFIIHADTYNTARDGQTPTFSDMWPDYAGFYVVPKDGAGGGQSLPPGVGPQVGRSFVWRGPDNGDSNTGYGVRKYRDDTRDAWISKVRHHVDEGILQTDAAYLFTDLTAA